MRFRFFKRDNLQSTRRRSASCPDLHQAGFRDTNTNGDGATLESREESSSESEADAKEPVSKFERLQAQRSIRRVRQKEKEKMENVEKNLLSMDDYLGKQSELKAWLREEKQKEPDLMRSPKLKAHFKTFIRLWNKRKLPAKYYRTCSVDLEAADQTLDLDTEVMEGSATPRYPLLDEPTATPTGAVTPIFPGQVVDLSPGNALDGRGLDRMSVTAADSPFSTFGKAHDGDDGLLSPAVLAKEMQVGMLARQENQERGNNQGTGSAAQSDPSSLGPLCSPTKFATISRSTPTSSALKLSSFSSVNRSEAEVTRLCPVSSPTFPPTVPGSASKFSFRPLPDTPKTSKTLPHGHSFHPPLTGAHNEVSPANRQLLVAGWNQQASDQSPVYASVKDAIPYSNDSPKYAEIDECGIPRLVSSSHGETDHLGTPANLSGFEKNAAKVPHGSEEGISRIPHNSEENVKSSLSSWRVESDYCSLSPPSTGHSAISLSSQKKGILLGKKPSLNRRRSKSMEDIYAVPFRADFGSRRRRQPLTERESPGEQNREPPPVPSKNFSPQSAFQTFLGFKSRRATPSKTSSVQDVTGKSVLSSPAGNVKKDSPQKRRSQENVETSLKISPPKKAKAEFESTPGSQDSASVASCSGSEAWSTTESSSCGSNGLATPSKLSILTGSMRPTTRSAKKAAVVANTGKPQADAVAKSTVVKSQSNLKEEELGVLEVKQLEESPKFPRRKLKRRSSSFSVTPGKGLTFGKSSKLCAASPRRVSFAKDVKDTEGSRSTPRRRSSSRRNVMPAAGVTVTRQTRESQDFQSFMSSHVSPPGNTSRTRSPSRVSSAGKPPSPIKTSLTNLLGGLRKKSDDPDVVPKALPVCPQAGGGGRSEVSTTDLHNSPLPSHGSLTSLSSNKLPAGGNLFPPSPTRQVGRRVLGSPIKQPSHGVHSRTNYTGQENAATQESTANHPPSLSSARKKNLKSKPADSVSSVSPSKKPIQALMSKLSSKTSLLCADQAGESDGNSSSDDLLDQNSGANTLRVVTGRAAFTDEPLLRFDSSFNEADEFMPGLNPDHGFKDQLLSDKSRAADVKAFTRVARIWNRTVGFDASVEPFVRKNTLSSYAVGSSMTAQSGTGEGTNRDSVRRVKYWAHNNTNEPKEGFAYKGRAKRGADLSTAGPRCASSSSASDGYANLPIAAPSATDGDLSFTLPPYPEATEKEAQGADLMASASAGGDPPRHGDLSFSLPPYPGQEPEATNDDDVFLTETEQRVKQKVPVGSSQSVCNTSHYEEPSFILPPYPEEHEAPVVANEKSLRNTPTGANIEQTGLAFSVAGLEPPAYEEPSFVLPPYPDEPQVPTGSQRPDLCSKDASADSPGRAEDPSFTLPPYPEEPQPPTDGRNSFLASSVQVRACEGNPDAVGLSKTENDSSILPPNPEEQNTITGNEAVGAPTDDLETSRRMQRIESLRRASPKVVSNDSWITERRRSSRSNSRGQRSFRSAHNRFLLRSAAVTEGRNGEGEICNGNSEAETFGGENTSTTSVFQPSSLTINECKNNVPDSSAKELPQTVHSKENPWGPTLLHTNAVTPNAGASLQKSTAYKPATLPKPAKGTSFAQRRLNVQNFIASNSSPRPTPKRRSSLTKRQTPKGDVRLKEDYITKNINAVKRDPCQPTVTRTSSRSAAPNTMASEENKVARKRSSVGTSEGRRRSKDQAAGGSGSAHKPAALSTKLSVFSQGERGARKRSSVGEKNADTRRRRSKSHGEKDENQMSFSERRRFFQQLQASNKQQQSSPLKQPRSVPARGTLHSLNKAPPAPHSAQSVARGDHRLPATPKPASLQTRKVQESKALALSPHSDLNV